MNYEIYGYFFFYSVMLFDFKQLLVMKLSADTCDPSDPQNLLSDFFKIYLKYTYF